MQARLCDRCGGIMEVDYTPLLVTVKRDGPTKRHFSVGAYPLEFLPSGQSNTKEFCKVCSEQFDTMYAMWLRGDG